jgi:hypothetical protein
MSGFSHAFSQEQPNDDYCSCVVNPFKEQSTKKIQDNEIRLRLFSHYLNDLVGVQVNGQISGGTPEVNIWMELNNREIKILRKLFKIPYLKGDTLNYESYAFYCKATYKIAYYVFYTVLNEESNYKDLIVSLSGKNDKRHFEARLHREGNYVTLDKAQIKDYCYTQPVYWRSNKSKLQRLFNN